MSDRDDLLRAVLAAPEDDAPRLIYADWLDEHGHPERAEFVRLQCAMDRIPPKTGRWRPLHERTARLEREWRATWAGAALKKVLNIEFRRGFVDRVRLTVEQFLASAEDLFGLEPLRTWEFTSNAFFVRGRNFADVACCPAFDRVRGVACGNYLPEELVTALAESRYLGGLRSLSVSYRLPGPREIAGLFAAAPNLVELSAQDAPVKNLRELWRRGAPARLRRLELVHSRLTDQGVHQLATSPALDRLEVLRLDGNDLSARAAEAIASSDYLYGLRELSFAGTQLADYGAVALAQSPVLKNLRVLNLTGCYVDNAGAQALADSPYLDQIECLCLDENRVSVEVENELAKRFGPGTCSFSWSPP
ncbi:MAG TPA: TIGR02996 domain-containing protein [Gemmataceae bacterium]|nr:TIGR02996 domain-containing protein [Gemmataceae bacterium]